MKIHQLIATILAKSESLDRFVVAIAGPPGAGKSTLAASLVDLLPSAKILPMDGFHYDNAVLDQLGLRARKGAPETFDFNGYQHTLQRISKREPNIAIPVFDRTMDLARGGAELIQPTVKFVITEGNYLLLNQSPWTSLAQLFNLTVFLDIPRPELQHRLTQRWLELGRTQQQAMHWVASNDMPNVDLVQSSRRHADIVLA